MKIYVSAMIVLVSAFVVFGQRSSDRISLRPCEVPGTAEGKKESVLCGSYEVFENRESRSGRKIALKIVVFPATGKDRSPDPLFHISGGPGSSATEDAPYIAEEFVKIRERRDLVFVDQRGTGGSNPLNCTFFDPKDIQSYLGHWNPIEQVSECRRELEPKADLRLYVTSIAMDDLDDVREALGYKQINVSGSSYGTRAALTYVKRHSANVRSVLLHGVSPFDQFMPRDFPQHTQRALEGVLDECLADAACIKAFPDIRNETKAVLEKLKNGPVEVNVTVEKKAAKVKLSRDLAGEAIRYMLYQSGAASRIPLVIHAASQGNFTPLAEAAIFYRQVIVATGSNGMYLSVTCAEDLPWIKKEDGLDADNTFLGSYRLRQQRQACTLWPRSDIPKDYTTPTRSNVPTLIFSGQWDPVTPPSYGENAAKNLPNSVHVVVPSGGHGFGGLEGLNCISDLATAFVDNGSARGLDTSCVRSIRRNGFVLQQKPPAS